MKLATLISIMLGLAAQAHARNVVDDEEPRIIWLPPRLETAVDAGRWVRVTQGTVIARERGAAAQAHLANDARIDLPERLGGGIPPGTSFARRLKDGLEDSCLIRSGRSASEDVVQLCLRDSDGDGLHDLRAFGCSVPAKLRVGCRRAWPFACATHCSRGGWGRGGFRRRS